MAKHLYKAGAKRKMRRSFIDKYGPRGSYIYGAVAGKVKRQRRKKYGHR